MIAAIWQSASPRARPGLEEQLLSHLTPFLEREARRAASWLVQEDALQIARFAALRSLVSFQQGKGATFWTWCYGCVRNALRDEISKARYASEHQGALPEHQELEDTPSDPGGLDTDLRLDLQRALASLTNEELREVCRLRYEESLTLRQIGAKFDRSGEWARRRLERALKQLREQMTK